jgi:hypothetical protein
MSQYILLQLYKKTTYFYLAQPLSRNITTEHTAADERKPSNNAGKIFLQLNFM